MLDEVVDTGEAPSEVLRSSLEPYMSFTLRCREEAYLNGQNRLEVLWRTLIWDFDVTRSQHPASHECGTSLRTWLLFNICKAIREQVRAGRRRSECFLSMRNLVDLARRDPTGIIPRLYKIRAVYDVNGVLEDGLDAERESPPNTLFRPRGSVVPPHLSWTLHLPPLIRLRPILAYIGLAKATLDWVPSRHVEEMWSLSLRGGKIPLVLSSVGSPEEPRYHLLGDIYVHGIMVGETMSSSDMEWKWIQLV